MWWPVLCGGGRVPADPPIPVRRTAAGVTHHPVAIEARGRDGPRNCTNVFGGPAPLRSIADFDGVNPCRAGHYRPAAEDDVPPTVAVIAAFLLADGSLFLGIVK